MPLCPDSAIGSPITLLPICYGCSGRRCSRHAPILALYPGCSFVRNALPLICLIPSMSISPNSSVPSQGEFLWPPILNCKPPLFCPFPYVFSYSTLPFCCNPSLATCHTSCPWQNVSCVGGCSDLSLFVHSCMPYIYTVHGSTNTCWGMWINMSRLTHIYSYKAKGAAVGEGLREVLETQLAGLVNWDWYLTEPTLFPQTHNP